MKLSWLILIVIVTVILTAIITTEIAHRSSGKSTVAAATQHGRKIKYYWDSMLGPSSIRDHPGKSAMNMDLEPVYEDDASSNGEIIIDPTVVQNMGLRTAEVTQGPLAKSIRGVGMLQVPEPGQHDVTLKIGGWIEKLIADQDGVHVSAGDPLFEIYSPDLLVAEEELIGAIKAKGGQDLIDSAKQKLKLWDIADKEIDAIAAASSAPRTVLFRSPFTGHIVEKAIVQGAAITPGQKLMRIEDHSSLWLESQLYEDQIPLIAVGQTVNAVVDGFPGKTFTGKITLIYPHLDHMARTLMVRSTLDNGDLKLRPGMFAKSEIILPPIQDVLQIPREAVIDTGPRKFVFLSEPAGRFVQSNVTIGIVGDNDQVQILSGLEKGQAVVVSGQFLLDSEQRTREQSAEKLSK